jgi:hypothetical protein
VELQWCRLREMKTREEEAIWCGCFRRRRERGGETAPRCQRRMTQQRVAWRPRRSKAAAGVWGLKMTKGNWVVGLNARLDQTADWAGEKIWLRV